MIFWIVVAAVIVVVLLGAWAYDRRHGTRTIRPPENDDAVGKARIEVNLRNIRDLGSNGPGI